ncbi:MAG TPA: hypothetical protein VFF81_10195 [Noviherbaspirillum sp.]|nr:hypothetical protein [Noviherbaspirillum sp.]
MKKTVLVAALLCSSLYSFAQQISDNAVDTVGGKVRVAGNDYEKQLFIGTKPIPKIGPTDHVKIEKKYTVGGKDVLLVSNQCGGSGCAIVGWNFVTVAPGGAVVVSQEMFGADGQKPVITVTNDKITIKLVEFEGRKTKTTTWTYENGAVKKG